MGVQIVNFTPGTGSNADYTIPEMPDYRSSDTIFQNIVNFEKQNGLNGFLMLMHIGTDPRREDKLYDRLDELIKFLTGKGYSLKRIDDLLTD